MEIIRIAGGGCRGNDDRRPRPETGDGACGGGGSCPTVFKTKDGKLVIQGLKLREDLRGSLAIPSDEDAVEIPEALLLEAVVNLKSERPF